MKLPKQILPNAGFDRAGECFRCGKPVAFDKAVILEQDQRYAEWHDFGVSQQSYSFGPAIFGHDCAKAMRKRAEACEIEHVETRDQYLERMHRVILETLAGPGCEGDRRVLWEYFLAVIERDRQSLK